MKGPIPGQSLTVEPGSPQYERPPRLNTQEEAFDAYVEKFDNPEARDALFQLLESEVPLSSIVTVLTREAVRKGVHSMDLAIVMRPIVHEYLTALADAAGVQYEEDALDKPKREAVAKAEKKAVASIVKRQLESSTPPEDEVSSAVVEEPVQEETPEQGPVGLMAKPQPGMM